MLLTRPSPLLVDCVCITGKAWVQAVHQVKTVIPEESVMKFMATLGGPGDSVTAATEHKYSVLGCKKSISISVTAPLVVKFTFSRSDVDFKWTL